MKKILFSALACFAISSHAYSDERWVCKREVDWTGAQWNDDCPRGAGGRWECYEDIEETCKEQNTGEIKVYEYRRSTGRCVEHTWHC